MAHIAGLVAAGVHPSPVPHADIVTCTTTKTLRGPRGGSHSGPLGRVRRAASSRAVFPGLQGSMHTNVIAAKAVCLGEALRPEFRFYAQRVVANARALAATLQERGVWVVGGGTDTHMVLLDLSSVGLLGWEGESALARAGITSNNNPIPFDARNPAQWTGIRLGTAAVTTRGFGTAEMTLLGECIAQLLKAEAVGALEQVKPRLALLTGGDLPSTHPSPANRATITWTPSPEPTVSSTPTSRWTISSATAPTRRLNPDWNWHPQLPLENSPLFVWPPRPADIARWFARSWLKLSMTVIILALSMAVWTWLQPPLERFETFAPDWIGQILLRNALLITGLAGSLHLYLHRAKRQGDRHKFTTREFARNNRTFTLNNQVRDNVLWSLASGVPIWSGYEVLYLWALANSYIPALPATFPLAWMVALLFVTPLWLSFHFYWVHRLLHWPPVYRRVHSLHHRNVHIGPWSGTQHAPLRAHVVFQLDPHPCNRRFEPADHVLPPVPPSSQPRRVAFGLQRPAHQGQIPRATRSVLPSAPPPPLQLQPRHSERALRPVARLVPRWVCGGYGASPGPRKEDAVTE